MGGFFIKVGILLSALAFMWGCGSEQTKMQAQVPDL
jgi:hypothetical protein